MSRSLPSVDCPHCRGSTKIRSSRTITPVYREIYYACQALDCGFTFKADLSVVCGLSPSARPHPRANIPFGDRAGRGPAIAEPFLPERLVAANDVGPRAANDDAPLAPVVAETATG